VLALSLILAVVLHVSIEKLRKLYTRTRPQLENIEPIAQVIYVIINYNNKTIIT